MEAPGQLKLPNSSVHITCTTAMEWGSQQRPRRAESDRRFKHASVAASPRTSPSHLQLQHQMGNVVCRVGSPAFSALHCLPEHHRTERQTSSRGGEGEAKEGREAERGTGKAKGCLSSTSQQRLRSAGAEQHETCAVEWIDRMRSSAVGPRFESPGILLRARSPSFPRCAASSMLEIPSCDAVRAVHRSLSPLLPVACLAAAVSLERIQPPPAPQRGRGGSGGQGEGRRTGHSATRRTRAGKRRSHTALVPLLASAIDLSISRGRKIVGRCERVPCTDVARKNGTPRWRSRICTINCFRRA